MLKKIPKENGKYYGKMENTDGKNNTEDIIGKFWFTEGGGKIR